MWASRPSAARPYCRPRIKGAVCTAVSRVLHPDRMRFLIDDGRVLTGTYGYSDRYVTVKTVHGSKITQRGRLPPESLARIMLRELADEGKA